MVCCAWRCAKWISLYPAWTRYFRFLQPERFRQAAESGSGNFMHAVDTALLARAGRRTAGNGRGGVVPEDGRPGNLPAHDRRRGTTAPDALAAPLGRVVGPRIAGACLCRGRGRHNRRGRLRHRRSHSRESCAASRRKRRCPAAWPRAGPTWKRRMPSPAYRNGMRCSDASNAAGPRFRCPSTRPAGDTTTRAGCG